MERASVRRTDIVDQHVVDHGAAAAVRMVSVVVRIHTRCLVYYCVLRTQTREIRQTFSTVPRTGTTSHIRQLAHAPRLPGRYVLLFFFAKFL